MKFMLAGAIVARDVLETWVADKKSREIDPMRLRPHPKEFYLYCDA
jgi:glutamine synthetase